jgi:hypothetical protein
VIGLAIYETDYERADLSTNSEAWCRKCAEALFPAFMALLGGSGATRGRQPAVLLSA